MSDPTMTVEQQLAALQTENAALKAKAAAKQVIKLKVSEKGGLSVYGLGRFPVTLYAQQWGRLIAVVPEIAAFIEANKGKLSYKE